MRKRKGKTAFNTVHKWGNKLQVPTISCSGCSLPRARNLSSSECRQCLFSSSSLTFFSDTSSLAFISASWKASDRRANKGSRKVQHLKVAFKCFQLSADEHKGVDLVACEVSHHWLTPSHLQASLLWLQWKLLMILGKLAISVNLVRSLTVWLPKDSYHGSVPLNEFSILMFLFSLLQFGFPLQWCTSKWPSQKHRRSYI